jgi:polynucleotide 5'-kinase involved in rRNA processing
VGTTSAARNVVSAVVGVRRMLDRARALDLEHVIVDTSGLIAGDLGRTLKQAKIDVTDPDLVICLEAHGECEPIVHPYARRDRPRIVRLPPLAAPRRRSADDRRRHRAAALARHLAAARPQTLDLARVALRQPALLIGEPLGAVQLLDASDAAGTPVLWGERSDAAIALVAERRLTPAETGRIAGALGGGTVVSHGLDELVGVLAGLDDLHGEMRGIGVVRAVDFRAREMVVDTAVPADVIAVVTVGKERFEET